METLGRKEIYANIAAHNKALNAYLQIVPETAAQAGAGPLSGVCIGVKDNIAVAGLQLTCGSKLLERYVAPYTATVVERLVAAGATVTGKLNMDEFAMGSATTYSAYGDTKNPWDEERTPGGSSGGSAAAVAAKMCDAALGSDTGGSVRQPASYCGIYGYKPTYGTLSRYGLTAFASSLDQIGILTRRPGDIREIMAVAAGHDGRDATSIAAPSFAAQGFDPAKMRIGIITEYEQKMNPAVRPAYDRCIEKLKTAGATIIPLSFPEYDTVISVYQVIATAEASANLSRFDGIRYTARAEGCDFRETTAQSRGRWFGPEVKRRILLGTWVLSRAYYDSYYLRAAKVRTVILKRWQEFFGKVDLVLTPATAGIAFKRAEQPDTFALYLEDLFTIPANLTGMPAIAVPAATHDRLPVGLQLTADLSRDGMLLDAAEWLDKNFMDCATIERGCRHDTI
ncbi:MAG TPA: Asp-tRNA(Asn)/Glu-tRNA(Gln) amidotransferase subunit GatA [bacterium]|nr:Asp-tRNA(Asn)/Glu-tRNA(Gln) amidotransferase subunit GatA [bacterium]